MDRWVVKLFALVGTFLLPLICTLLPYKVSGYIARRGTSGKQMLSYLMCFGGGIFFGTYLLHMGPEVQTILRDALLDPYGITYPVAELIVGIGFFIVLFAEKLVLRWNKRRIRVKHKSRQQPSPLITVVNGADQTCSRNKCVRPPSEEMCPECIDGKQCAGDKEKMHGLGGVEDATAAGRDQSQCSYVIDASSHLLSQPADDTTGNVDASQQCAKPVGEPGACCTHGDAGRNGPETDRQVTAKNDDVETGPVEMHGGHHHATRSLILILALSLHRIFEGMSIGLQQTVTNVVSLFGAVMCHEMVIGFSLGLQFVRSGFALRRLVITSFVCSSIMPLGVLIGLVMTEVESTSGNIDIANGLLQAIAMGTFIYVTFFEILQEEVDSEDTSLGKIVFIAAGFALMALLNLIPEGEFVATSHVFLNTSTPIPPINDTVKA